MEVLTAKKLNEGDRIRIYIKKYIGVNPYKIGKKIVVKDGFFRVITEGGEDLVWRISNKEFAKLRGTREVIDYGDLVGRVLTLEVKNFEHIGAKGFVVVEFSDKGQKAVVKTLDVREIKSYLIDTEGRGYIIENADAKKIAEGEKVKVKVDILARKITDIISTLDMQMLEGG